MFKFIENIETKVKEYEKSLEEVKANLKDSFEMFHMDLLRYLKRKIIVFSYYNKKYISILLFILAIFMYFFNSNLNNNSEDSLEKVRNVSEYIEKMTDTVIALHYDRKNINSLKNKPFDNYFELRHVLSQKTVDANMLGTESIYGLQGNNALEGRFIRTMRFYNLTRFLEIKYSLPENIIFGIIMCESTGVDLLPNSGDDGGVGLTHTQAIVAENWNLRVHKHNGKLVDVEHGRRVRSMIESVQDKPFFIMDRKELCEFDDRLNNLLNLDNCARILKFHAIYPRDGVADAIIHDGLEGFTGKKTDTKYKEKVLGYMNLLKNKHFLNDISTLFNKNNEITFEAFCADWWLYNENYFRNFE